MRIESIQKSPKCSGKTELLNHMDGKLISRAQAMKAKCFECCNGFIDGRVDCGICDCPLYAWMPYRVSRPTVVRRQKKQAPDSGLDRPSDTENA